MAIFPVQFITADIPDYSHTNQAIDACNAGIRWIQYRTKNTPHKEWVQQAKQIREITAKHQCVFIVNDNPQVAIESNADGVHVGKHDVDLAQTRHLLRDKIVGYSCNTIADLVFAQHHQADYAGIGPYRYTSTKHDLNPLLGQEGLMQVVAEYSESKLSVPIVAIGGIDFNDIDTLLEIGIRQVAVSSCIIRALRSNQFEHIQRMIHSFEKFKSLC